MVSTSCRCERGVETLDHFLFRCSLWIDLRQQIRQLTGPRWGRYLVLIRWLVWTLERRTFWKVETEHRDDLMPLPNLQLIPRDCRDSTTKETKPPLKRNRQAHYGGPQISSPPYPTDKLSSAFTPQLCIYRFHCLHDLRQLGITTSTFQPKTSFQATDWLGSSALPEL